MTRKETNYYIFCYQECPLQVIDLHVGAYRRQWCHLSTVRLVPVLLLDQLTLLFSLAHGLESYRLLRTNRLGISE